MSFPAPTNNPKHQVGNGGLDPRERPRKWLCSREVEHPADETCDCLEQGSDYVRSRTW